MNLRCIALVAATLITTACASPSHSYIMEPLAKLPSGDRINSVAVILGTQPTGESYIEWRRAAAPQQPDLVMVKPGAAPSARAKDDVKILTIHGIPLPSGNATHTPEQLDRAHRFWQQWNQPPRNHAQLTVSPDGNRAWLSVEGQTFASFDYQQAAAYLGEENQPTWAAATQPSPAK